MANTGRKRNSPEGTRNQMSFVVEDETLNRFMEAKDVLQNSMPEALQTVKITKVDALRGLIEFFLKHHANPKLKELED